VELRHLRYFVAVAEELHFRRAAERLHVSQPPLSQQIRALERELGVTLFERNRRRVELTAPGRALLTEARAVLAAVDHAVDLTQRVARGEAGALAVGFVGSAMYGALPDVLRDFRAARPGVELKLRELPTGAALEALAEERIDVGVVRPAQVDEGIAIDVVRREAVVVALPAAHALTRRRRLTLRDLGGEPMVVLSRREAPGLRGALDALGEPPGDVQEVSEIRTVLGLVSAGLGLSLVPESVSTGERAGVVFRPIEGRAPTVDLALAWRRDDTSPALAAFLEVAHAGLSEHRDGETVP
jgi:DNA-binding transcriptional LysR family regulator